MREHLILSLGESSSFQLNGERFLWLRRSRPDNFGEQQLTGDYILGVLDAARTHNAADEPITWATPDSPGWGRRAKIRAVDLLYKYRAFDTERDCARTLQILQEGKVWLATPSFFNDLSIVGSGSI